MDTKTCSVCKQQKFLIDFGRDKSTKDGLSYRCKECNKQQTKKWQEDNRDKYLEAKRAYDAANRTKRLEDKAQYRASHRKEIAAYAVAYREAHRDKLAAYKAAYDDEHREGKAARCAAWQKANPDKVRAASQRHRARKLINGGMHTAGDIQRQGDSQKWKCWWRGPGCTIDCREKYEVDHLVPLSRGGHNGPSNIVISCRHCNRKKHAKLPEEWCGKLF